MQRRAIQVLLLALAAAMPGCAAPSQLREASPDARGPSTVAVLAPKAPVEALVAPARPARDYVTLDVEDEPLADVITRIARQTRRNILVTPGARARVTLTLEKVHWLDAVELIAERYGCDITVIANGHVRTVCEVPRVTLRFD